ncbi:BRCT domain-containing protein [Flavobacterium sp. SM15]|uniref:BRCT domain-containing protein n=1 Tax=Flavobacterium sp. SM15 TaxID=2908005 RepID=UPI001EDA5CD3|nr:BRCT domain-containing protein [Flavobacterium sp. SM15]MCG2610778.1 BRCT domain-containing protein [Flavobacterium sp. SM15]
MILSNKLLSILKSKTELTETEIENLTEKKGWEIVYSLKQKKEPKIEICFTGYNPSEKEQLTKIAIEKGFHIAKSITVNLNFLCCGSNAGEVKIQKAKEQNAILLSTDEFYNLVETGEVPL